MRHKIRFLPEAEEDLNRLYFSIALNNSPLVARRYVDRISTYIDGFRDFPARGTMRDDIGPGIRMVGFERRVTIVFKIISDEVTITRILYAGRQLPEAE